MDKRESKCLTPANAVAGLAWCPMGTRQTLQAMTSRVPNATRTTPRISLTPESIDPMPAQESFISVPRLKTYRANLRHWYRQSSQRQRDAGRVWYEEAQDTAEFISRLTAIPQVRVAGVISALSPNNKWNRNRLDALRVCDAVARDLPEDAVKVCTYNSNKRKAFAIARGDEKILKASPKTYAFALNVGACDPNHVTVDKWHLRACQTRSKSPKEVRTTVTPVQYRALERECLRLAREHDVPGYVFQATVWVTIRDAWMS